MKPTISIFTCPKAFTGEFEQMQINAIRSWKAFDAQVILIGNDEGVEYAADSLGCKWGGEVARNAYGTPLLNNIWVRGHAFAECKLMAYVNADILLWDDFLMAATICAETFPQFLMCGQRGNVDIGAGTRLTFEGDAGLAIARWLKPQAQLEGIGAADYFTFTKGTYGAIPPFALGRYRWDNWLMDKMHRQNTPFIDATEAVFAAHQNHSKSHDANAHELEYNDRLVSQSGGNLGRLTDANWTMSADFQLHERVNP